VSAKPRSLAVRVLGASVSGVLLSLAFPPADYAWVAFVALVPFVLALRGASGRTGALTGLAFGVTFFGILVYWISYFGYAAWIALVLLQAVATVLFGGLAARLGARYGAAGRLIAWPVLWSGLELARSRVPLGGFAWGDIGYTQHGGGAVLHLARLGGVYLLGLAIVVVNVLAAEMIGTASTRRRFTLAVAAIIIVIAPAALPLGAGGARTGSLDVVAIQGNVPRDRFTGLGRQGRIGPEDFTIVENHLRETRALLSAPRPDLVLWPENSFDRDPREWPQLFDPVLDLAAGIGAPFLIGAILDEGEHWTNSNLLLEPSGEITQRYDKIHMVPFGEYVPWTWARRLVPALDRELPLDGTPGKSPFVFQVGDARLGSLICFESTYPSLARALVRNGARVLVVTTNNASFGTSPAARQHLSMSRMRAVEHGVPLVQAAISGISAIVEPDGTIVKSAGLFTAASLRSALPLSDGRTPYTRYGAWIEFSLAALAFVVALGAMRKEGAT